MNISGGTFGQEKWRLGYCTFIYYIRRKKHTYLRFTFRLSYSIEIVQEAYCSSEIVKINCHGFIWSYSVRMQDLPTRNSHELPIHGKGNEPFEGSYFSHGDTSNSILVSPKCDTNHGSGQNQYVTWNYSNWKIPILGGFNPIENYHSPKNRDENKEYLSCHHLDPMSNPFETIILDLLTSVSPHRTGTGWQDVAATRRRVARSVLLNKHWTGEANGCLSFFSGHTHSEFHHIPWRSIFQPLIFRSFCFSILFGFQSILMNEHSLRKSLSMLEKWGAGSVFDHFPSEPAFGTIIYPEY